MAPATRGPRISVLLPVYNAEPFLDACLASLCASRDADFEICAIDDGSTDASRERLESWRDRDPRIRLATQPNRGVARTRNALFEMARGEILVLQDADDLSHRDRLARIRASFEARRWDIFHSRSFLLDEASRIRAASFLLRPLGLFLRGGHCPIVHGSAAITRKALERVGAYRELPAEDHDLWLRCLAAGLRLHFCPEPLYARRIHGGSLTSRTTRRLHASSQSLRSHPSPIGIPDDIGDYYRHKIAVTFGRTPLREVMREHPGWASRIYVTRALGRLMARRYRNYAEGYSAMSWGL
jgi:glycosyltransferase involved in cell wall biosynthesis